MNLYDVYKEEREIELDKIPEDLVAHLRSNLSRLGLGPIETNNVNSIINAARVLNEILEVPNVKIIGKQLAKYLIETKESSEETRRKSWERRVHYYMLKHNMYISYEAGTHNIVYLEGVSSNFTVNKDEPNEFNDLRCLLSFKQGVPVITNYWVATTEPGKYYTENPMNPKGAARIQFGQYTAWRVGVHGKDRHRALVQVNPITVCRDVNKDYARARDIEDTGLFGVNQHGGYDQPEKNIGRASAGCLVGRSMKEHQEFMRIITKDPRYIADAKFIWPTAICAGNQV